MKFNEAWNRKVPDFFCPYCNKTLSGSISPKDLNAIPSKGDVTVCCGCLQTSEFTDDMKLKKVDAATLDVDTLIDLHKIQVNLQEFKNRISEFRIWRSYPTPKMIYDTDKLTSLDAHDEPMKRTDHKDKNGIFAYEGDILNCENKLGLIKRMQINHNTYYIAIDWIDNRPDINLFSDMDFIKQGAIIGNIFENPELIPDAC